MEPRDFGSHQSENPLPDIFVPLFAHFRKLDSISYNVHPYQFANCCVELNDQLKKIFERIRRNPFEHETFLRTIYETLAQKTTELLSLFVKDYNHLSDVSTVNNDKGYTVANLLFILICQSFYLSEICLTITRMTNDTKVVCDYKDHNGEQNISDSSAPVDLLVYIRNAFRISSFVSG